MKALPIGKDNLKKIIEEDCYYIDKTKIIEQILENRSDVTLFPRPRRFGKSLTISTIDEFFNIEKKKANKDLFKGLYIEKSKFKEEQGKYPVIKLNFKNFQSDNWEMMILGIREHFRQIFEDKKYLKEKLDDDEKAIYNEFLDKTADMYEYQQSITILSRYMEKYYNQKVILLIDEYDVPIQDGYMHGFYDKIVSFIKSLFNSGLKTNNSIKFAVMTGVLRVSKESIFSDLNNVKIYSVVDEKYDEYFGFTEQETKELLKYYGLELTENVKNMYNGYTFGNTQIYNPWSIINYASDKKLRPYWVNTSGDKVLKDIFRKSKEQTAEMLEELILGKSIECIYNEKVTFLDLDNIEQSEARDLVANFLLVSGYLTQEKGKTLDDDTGKIVLKIPNNEVRTVYRDVILNWMNKDAYMSSYQLAIFRKAMEKVIDYIVL